MKKNLSITEAVAGIAFGIAGCAPAEDIHAFELRNIFDQVEQDYHERMREIAAKQFKKLHNEHQKLRADLAKWEEKTPDVVEVCQETRRECLTASGLKFGALVNMDDLRECKKDLGDVQAYEKCIIERVEPRDSGKVRMFLDYSNQCQSDLLHNCVEKLGPMKNNEKIRMRDFTHPALGRYEPLVVDYIQNACSKHPEILKCEDEYSKAQTQFLEKHVKEMGSCVRTNQSEMQIAPDYCELMVEERFIKEFQEAMNIKFTCRVLLGLCVEKGLARFD